LRLHSPSVDFFPLKSRQGYSFDPECFNRLFFAVQTFHLFHLLQFPFLVILYSVPLLVVYQILALPLPRFFPVIPCFFFYALVLVLVLPPILSSALRSILLHLFLKSINSFTWVLFCPLAAFNISWICQSFNIWNFTQWL
jgi:hypothetical protein